MQVERITREEAHRRMMAQSVSADHIAFSCPMCGTVQSMATLVAAGCPRDKVEQSIAFSCEGRFTNAGPWPAVNDDSETARKRRMTRGCNWTLGGLFTIHRLEIEFPGEQEPCPTFEIVDAATAQALKRDLSAIEQAYGQMGTTTCARSSVG